MDEKIREEFNKSWESDNEEERYEAIRKALIWIKEAVENQDFEEIEDIIRSLENEIGEI